MEWTHSETLALADAKCTRCLGVGLLPSTAPCGCVFRNIFRICYARFRYCAHKEGGAPIVNLERSDGGRSTRAMFGHKNHEYMADFCLLAKRILTDPTEVAVFKFHFLLGADKPLCCRRLGLDRGTFWHAVYRVQEKLGRAFREVRPFPLFPLDEYFSAPMRGQRVEPCVPRVVPSGPRPLRPPLAPAA